jgi:hypothetical protein
LTFAVVCVTLLFFLSIIAKLSASSPYFPATRGIVRQYLL